MLTDKLIHEYLDYVENELMSNKNNKRTKVDFSKDWTKGFPSKPGIYAVF